MKQLLDFIIRNIVENPKKVEISETEEEGYTSLKINVADEDAGKVIGKNGKVIKAIRTLLKTSAIKKDRRIFLDLVDTK